MDLQKIIDTLIFPLVPSHFVSPFLPCLELNVKLEIHRLARRCILSNPLLILSSIVLYLTTTYFILTDNCCLVSVLWPLQIIINSDKMVTVGVVVKQPRRRRGIAQFHISVCTAFGTTILGNLFVSPTTQVPPPVHFVKVVAWRVLTFHTYKSVDVGLYGKVGHHPLHLFKCVKPFNRWY